MSREGSEERMMDEKTGKKETKVAALERRFGLGVVIFVMEIAMIILYSQLVTYAEEAVDKVGDQEDASNTISVYYPFFQDVHVMIFIGFGFLMTLLRKYQWSALGFTMLVSAMTIQWSILVVAFFHNAYHESFNHKIHLDITSLIMGDFASAAVLISFGAILG